MNTQVQTQRPVSPVASFNAFMQKHKNQLELALPKHLNADRMVRLALTSFSQNPELQKCESTTIFGSIIVAAQLGLEPGVNGQGYLIPYKGKCTFVPGWKGLVDLAQRGGRASVWTGAVYEGDDFDYMLGDSPYCKHRPCGEFDVAKLTHVYAIGRVKGSEMPVIEVWPVRKVREHFKKTVVKGLQPNHYSHKHFEAYARKVALLQVLKYMPQSIELNTALDVSSASEQGKNVTIDGDFITIENTPNIEDNETGHQDTGHSQVPSTPNQPTAENQATEDDYQAPTYAQIKRSILTAKSIAHTEVVEEQVLDHANSSERKELMKLLNAQKEKFVQPQTTVPKNTTKKTENKVQPQQVTPLDTSGWYASMDRATSIDSLNNIAQAIDTAEQTKQITPDEVNQLRIHLAQRKEQLSQGDLLNTQPKGGTGLSKEEMNYLYELIDSQDKYSNLTTLYREKIRPRMDFMTEDQSNETMVAYQAKVDSFS